MKYKSKKRFGQHFLKDTFLIQHILQLINPRSTEIVIEIGPGFGALTQPLSYIIAPVHVIEIDNDMIDFLIKQSYAKKLIIHHKDVLEFDFFTLPAPQKIIGNLPYNISTPLMFKLIQYIKIIDSMYFMLQKEIADKLVAQPGSAKFGKLSILLQYYFDIEILIEIPPSAFKPIPQVDSVFIRMMPNNNNYEQVNDWVHFSYLVKQAFSMKRKTIFNNLKSILSKNTLVNLNIHPDQRPEDISISQYVLLSNYLQTHLHENLE